MTLHPTPPRSARGRRACRRRCLARPRKSGSSVALRTPCGSWLAARAAPPASRSARPPATSRSPPVFESSAPRRRHRARSPEAPSRHRAAAPHLQRRGNGALREPAICNQRRGLALPPPGAHGIKRCPRCGLCSFVVPPRFRASAAGTLDAAPSGGGRRLSFRLSPKQVGATCRAAIKEGHTGGSTLLVAAASVAVGAGRSRLGRHGSGVVRPLGAAAKSGHALHAQPQPSPALGRCRRVGKAHRAASAPPTMKRGGG